MQTSQSLVVRLRSGEWLEPRLVAFTASLMLAGTVLGLGFLSLTATGNIDQMGRPLGTDFSSFWTAGRLVLEGQPAALYDWKALGAAQTRLVGSHEFFSFSYPPLFLLLMTPLALLPYLGALAVWQAATGAAAALAAWTIIPSRRTLLLALAFPGVLLCLGHGQNGFLTAALLAGGVLLLARAEWAAGVLFGLVAYKPQFGLILPLALLAGGYWRAFAGASLTVAATVALTLILWGWPVWQAFFDVLPLQRREVLEMGAVEFHKFQSIFAWVRLIGGPIALAYTVQAAVTVTAVAATVWIWRGTHSRNLKGAALLAGALLSSPHVLDYDFVVLGMALAFLTAHALEYGFRPWEKTLIAAAWFAPAAARGIAEYTFIPLGFLTLAAVFGWIVMRAQSERTRLVARDAPAR